MNAKANIDQVVPGFNTSVGQLKMALPYTGTSGYKNCLCNSNFADAARRKIYLLSRQKNGLYYITMKEN
jgi:hypothetical protein